jgi:hypothetical protein
MTTGVQFDLREFRDAMRFYAKATKKDEASVLNRTARNFTIKAMMYTPVAEPGKIEGQLKSLDHPTFLRLVFARLNKKTVKGKNVLVRPKAGRGRDSRETMAVAMRKFLAHRKNTSKYIKRGWNKVAKEFGAAYDKLKGGYKGSKKSYGKKATETKLEAVFENASKGSGDVASEAVERALAATISDMRDYAYRTMQGTADKFSGKKR